MYQEPKKLYLDLMKKTLSFSMWQEPPTPVAASHVRSPFKRFLVSAIMKVLNRKKMQLVLKKDTLQKQWVEGKGWSRYADTMIGLKRLDNLQYCVETVLKDGVEGDLIETGVWNGGACIFMRAVLAAYGIMDRKVFVADSFEGLPKPDEKKYPADEGDTYYTCSNLAVSKQVVANNFRKYGLLDDNVVFLEGWFKDTLPSAPIEKLSVLRLDGDMYGSTMESLDCLYPKLSKGGFCIIDDYALKTCQMAVDDYRAKHNINSELKEIDWTGRCWRKE
jgi:O-methyltransferase